MHHGKESGSVHCSYITSTLVFFLIGQREGGGGGDGGRQTEGEVSTAALQPLTSGKKKKQQLPNLSSAAFFQFISFDTKKSRSTRDADDCVTLPVSILVSSKHNQHVESLNS